MDGARDMAEQYSVSEREAGRIWMLLRHVLDEHDRIRAGVDQERLELIDRLRFALGQLSDGDVAAAERGVRELLDDLGDLRALVDNQEAEA